MTDAEADRIFWQVQQLTRTLREAADSPSKPLLEPAVVRSAGYDDLVQRGLLR